MAQASGTVDYRDDHFVVSCPFDGSVHAELRALPRHLYDQGVWLVPRHVKSVAGLMAVARRQHWQLTRYAAQALGELREQAESAEFYLQVVQSSAGEPWFKCRADDADLEEPLRAVPCAERDDDSNTWIIPATIREACEHLRAIVGEDTRFEVDPAAQRLLEDPDEWPEPTPGSCEQAATTQAAPTVAVALPSTVDEVEAAFEREQELLAWSRSVIADAGAGSLLERRLRPYQRAGVRYLRSARRAFLADDKGLGKSVQALAAIEASTAYPALILCASSAEPQWEREVAHWLNERTCGVVDGSDARIPERDILIVQYELLHRVRDELKARNFKAIVADDSGELRNERSLKTRVALELAEAVDELRFCLSTKALFEQPMHLLPQLLFLGRIDDLQGRNAFVERYCRPRHDVSGTRYGAAHMAELEQRLRACCLCRRDASQVAGQLPSPPRHYHAVRSSASPEQRAREEALLSRLSSLRERHATTRDHEGSAAYQDELRAALAELRVLTGECKVDGVAEWIDHFLLSGEWLAVVVRHREIARAFERKYTTAVFVHANGTCERAGSAVNPFFVADSRLVFFEEGAAGAALRLARGRHVAVAELGFSAVSQAISELLRETKGGDYGGMEWHLMSDMALDQAFARVAEQQWPARDACNGEELDRLVQALLREERAPEEFAALAK